MRSLVSPCLCFWWIVKGPICFESLLTKEAKAICVLNVAEQLCDQHL